MSDQGSRVTHHIQIQTLIVTYVSFSINITFTFHNFSNVMKIIFQTEQQGSVLPLWSTSVSPVSGCWCPGLGPGSVSPSSSLCQSPGPIPAPDPPARSPSPSRPQLYSPLLYSPSYDESEVAEPSYSPVENFSDEESQDGDKKDGKTSLCRRWPLSSRLCGHPLPNRLERGCHQR